MPKNKGVGFSQQEKEAMQNRAKELAAEAKAAKKKGVGEKLVLDAISAMPEPDRTMAKKLHEIITKAAPELWPKTWYGMPAYGNKEGKVLCFFQGSKKFDTRYSSLGFNDTAKLDEGNMWPTAFALKSLTSAEEEKVAGLVKRAVG